MIALFLTSPSFRTLPVVMWGEVRYSLEPTVAVVAALLTLLTTAALAASALLQRRQVRR